MPPSEAQRVNAGLTPVISPKDSVLDLVAGPTPLPQVIADVWRARDLAMTLARRDFFSRYRRAALGVLWALALPLLQAAVLAVVFTRVAKLSLPVNAFVFVYGGMAAWSFFAAGVGTASTAIVEGQAMASRIYFPRFVLPLVSVLSSGYLLVINYLVAAIAAYLAGAHLSAWIFLLPVSMLFALVLTVFASASLAAIHVYFRDTKFLVQALLLVAFYLTPVFYPLTSAPPTLRRVAELNPMTGVIELARRATIGADPFWVRSVALSAAWIFVLAVVTGWLYSRYDRMFSDLL